MIFTVNLKNLCKKLRTLPQSELDRLKIRRSLATGEVQLKCLLERMSEYYEVSTYFNRVFAFSVQIFLDATSLPFFLPSSLPPSVLPSPFLLPYPLNWHLLRSIFICFRLKVTYLQSTPHLQTSLLQSIVTR